MSQHSHAESGYGILPGRGSRNSTTILWPAVACALVLMALLALVADSSLTPEQRFNPFEHSGVYP